MTSPAGADGTPCTHSWNGSVLTVTSASGTSSADLRGPQGETGPQDEAGATGATGPQGPKGETGDDGADGEVVWPPEEAGVEGEISRLEQMVEQLD